MKWQQRAIVLLLLGLVLSGCARSDFDTPANEAMLKQALIDGNLHVCAEEPIEWPTVPGFVSGTYLTVGIDCSTPGGNITVARFNSITARDGAMNNALNTHRVPGSHVARTFGPLIITIEGARSDEVTQEIVEALNMVGAK